MIIIKIILWALLAVLLIVILALAIPVRAAVRYSDDITVDVKYLFLKFTVVGGEPKPKKKKQKKQKAVRTSKKTSKRKINKTSKAEVKNNSIKNKKIHTEKTTVKEKMSSKSKEVEEDNISNDGKATENENKNVGKSNPAKKKRKEKKKAKKKEENAAVKWLKNTFKERGLSGLLNVFKELAKLAGTFLKPIFKHIRIKHLDLNITVAFEDAADTAVKYGYFCVGIYPALAVLLRVMKYDDYSVNIVPDFNKKEPEFDVFAEISLVPWFVIFGAVHALFNFIVLKVKGKI